MRSRAGLPSFHVAVLFASAGYRRNDVSRGEGAMETCSVAIWVSDYRADLAQRRLRYLCLLKAGAGYTCFLRGCLFETTGLHGADAAMAAHRLNFFAETVSAQLVHPPRSKCQGLRSWR